MNHKLYILLLIVPLGQCGYMKELLDGMQLLMEGTSEFDPIFYNELVSCLDNSNPRAFEANNALWQGTLDYALSYGDIDDTWTECDDLPANFTQEYFDKNCTVQTQEHGDLSALEPCNYASNVAYYVVSNEICKETWSFPQDFVHALTTSSSFLAHGSAMFHASQTELGHVLDVKMDGLMPYVAYQVSVKNLEHLGSSIITDLSLTPRSMNSIQITEEITDIILTESVYNWTEMVNDMDFPKLEISMCAFVETLATLTLPEETVDIVVDVILTALGDRFTEEMREFCIDAFLPEIRNATANLNLDLEMIEEIKNNSIGLLAKFLYGAIWQEHVFVENEELLTPAANLLGIQLLPQVNAWANQHLDWIHLNQDFQNGENIYPGETWCNRKIPHAKWHIEVAIAFLDMVYMAQKLYYILV